MKGVFFDAGGTLFSIRESVGHHYCRFAKQYGVNTDTAYLDKRFYTALEDAPPMAFPGVPTSQLHVREKEWWYNVVGSVFKGIAFDDFDAFFERVYRHFESEEAWILHEDVPQTLSLLCDRGYLLGIISNFDSRLETILEKLHIRHFFHAVICSSRAGAAKPAPEIFRVGMEALGLLPSEVVHVGDSPLHDVEGAQNVGITPLLIDRGRQGGIPAIHSLAAIIDFLDEGKRTC